MKKILEVLQYGDHELRFNTDIDVSGNPDIVLDTVSRAALTMTTTLWGGNEQSVMAMIRALEIADLAASVNRKQMLRYLDKASADIAKDMKKAKREFERHGGRVITFAPGIRPQPFKS